MAVRMTMDAVIARASLLKLVCLLALVPTLGVTHAAAQTTDPQPKAVNVQQQMPQLPPPVAPTLVWPILFWPFTVLGLVVVGLFSGMLATLALLYLRRDVQPTGAAPLNLVPSPETPQAPEAQTAQTALGLGSRIQTAYLKLLITRHRVARRLKSRLRRLIPPRRLVLRYSWLLLGMSLIVVSLFGFATGRVWESFVLLAIGYAIAVSVWLLPWGRTHSDSNESEETAPSIAVESSRNRQPAVTRPRVATRKRPSGPPKPSPEFVFAFNIINHHPIAETEHVPLAFATGKTGQLKCAPCGKEFNVRGEGNVGLRLIPCPQCGSALDSTGALESNSMPDDPNWVPIVSVACKHCRGLIDVPYATFGTSIPCPRCHADLPVPRLASTH